MNLNDCHIDRQTVQKLLSAGNGDVALLYLYIYSGNDPDAGQVQLRMTPARYQCAAATLRQLGLWLEEKPKHLESSEHPKYSEQDVLGAMGANRNARRTALMHLIFKVVGVSIFVIVFYGIGLFMPWQFLTNTTSAFDVAVVHTAYNVLATMVLIPSRQIWVKLA